MEEFAASHSHAIWTCLVKFLGIDGSAVSEAAKKAVTLPLSTGGSGIQNATRALPAVQWASWADALEMLRERSSLPLIKVTVLRQSSRCQVGRRWRRAQDRIDQTRSRDCGHSAKPRVAAPSVSGVGEEQSQRIAAGHHRAACATVGVLGRRGFALESGGRVRELDLHPGQNRLDTRRLEVLGT